MDETKWITDVVFIIIMGFELQKYRFVSITLIKGRWWGTPCLLIVPGFWERQRVDSPGIFSGNIRPLTRPAFRKQKRD